MHQRALRDLLDEELWLLGCDARASTGNRLLQLGLERHRPSDTVQPARGATGYRWQCTADRTLMVWGFGVWCAVAGCGSVLLPRRDPLPLRWSVTEEAPVHAHRLRDLAAWRRPRQQAEQVNAQRVAAHAMRALADYERAVAALIAPSEREQLLRGTRARPVAAARLPDAWYAMAQRFDLLEDSACSTRAA